MCEKRGSAWGWCERFVTGRGATARSGLQVQLGSLTAFRQSCVPVHQNPTDFVWPQLFCSYQLCSLIRRKTKKISFGQNYSATSVWKANRVCKHCLLVMKQLLLNKYQTQNQTKNPTISVSFLHRCSVGKKLVNLDGKECSLKVAHFFSWRILSHYCCLAGNSFEDYVHMIYASFIQTAFSYQVLLFPGNEVYLAAFLQQTTILHRQYLTSLRKNAFGFLPSGYECPVFLHLPFSWQGGVLLKLLKLLLHLRADSPSQPAPRLLGRQRPMFRAWEAEGRLRINFLDPPVFAKESSPFLSQPSPLSVLMSRMEKLHTA